MIKIRVNSDKSISHRSIIFGSIASGKTKVNNILLSDDCLATINIFKNLGVSIEILDNTAILNGVGLNGFKKPSNVLDVGNSGTSIRLISGILANQDFSSTISGDQSILRRPMKRIIDPLTLMGANIISNNNLAPLKFLPRTNSMHGIEYDTKASSAQVKSCILLSGLHCKGNTTVIEKYKSRNHTELMLKQFGGRVLSELNRTTVFPTDKLIAQEINVPGDISSAAFFIVAGLISPNTELILENVGLNPTRDGILTVCKKMNANIEITNKVDAIEPYGDIVVKYSKSLVGTTIDGEIIPKLIDEIPIICLLATQAEGKTVIKNIEDLKNKESNRIKSIFENLQNCGAKVEMSDDSLVIHGKTKLHPADIQTHNDHRIAMMFEIASLIMDSRCNIDNTSCIKTSYPDFYKHLNTFLSN